MRNNEFKTYHPIVNFIYFCFVILLSMFFMNPICLLMSVAGGYLYLLIIKEKSLKFNILYLLPVLIFSAMLNPLFNHRGVTILTYLYDGNPLTYESLIYGLCASLMLLAVVGWFSCYNAVMTSDKFMYLFGKVIPSLSLTLSMVLRFVPKFREQAINIIEVQNALYKGKKKTFKYKLKTAFKIMSVITTWILENSIDTVDSMRARGYGITGRTAYSVYRFDKRDLLAVLSFFALGVYILIGIISGNVSFDFFPQIKINSFSGYGLTIYISYFIFCMIPAFIEVKEGIRWKYLISKI